MGQINLPLLNRTGYSVFWQYCFDDKLNYRKSMHSSIISKKIIKSFFYSKFSKNFLFLKRKKIFNAVVHANINFKKIRKIKSTRMYKNIDMLAQPDYRRKFFSLRKRLPAYHTRVYFIKYNNWVILTFRVYVPTSKILRRRLKSKRAKLIRFRSNYWKLYYISLLKYKLNFSETKYGPEINF